MHRVVGRLSKHAGSRAYSWRGLTPGTPKDLVTSASRCFVADFLPSSRPLARSHQNFLSSPWRAPTHSCERPSRATAGFMLSQNGEDPRPELEPSELRGRTLHAAFQLREELQIGNNRTRSRQTCSLPLNLPTQAPQLDFCPEARDNNPPLSVDRRYDVCTSDVPHEPLTELGVSRGWEMSAFRPIRPSSDPGEGGLQPSALESSVTLGKTRKRRAPSHVSQNACTNCKKARAKVTFPASAASEAVNNRGDSVTAKNPLPAHAARAATSLSSVYTKCTSRQPKRSSCGR